MAAIIIDASKGFLLRIEAAMTLSLELMWNFNNLTLFNSGIYEKANLHPPSFYCI